MKQTEVIRTVLVTIAGVFLMLVVQPSLYQAGQINLQDVEPAEWLTNRYYPSAAIVLGACLTLQVLWYVLALKFKGDEREVGKKQQQWWILLTGVFVSIVVALFVSTFGDKGSFQALPSLLAFFLLDGAIIYWLATAISTPNRALKYIVPGSFYLRQGLFP
ncbi:MAG: hypothetical protein RLZZ148_2953 [Cyanobacteriota bacterium]